LLRTQNLPGSRETKAKRMNPMSYKATTVVLRYSGRPNRVTKHNNDNRMTNMKAVHNVSEARKRAENLFVRCRD